LLTIGNADVVASFADSLDTASVEQLKAIASRLDTLRQQRRES
jgi:predicted transcriptional regulator